MNVAAPGMVEKFATVGPFRIRFLDNEVGEAAEVVVLLHDGAWGASADATWQRTFAHLPAGVRVIAPDLLGFGGSDKAVFLDRSPYGFRALAVFDLLDHVGITGRVHLVGNSFGGSVALRALELPQADERLASVTTISGTGGPWRTPLALRELGSFDGTTADMDRLMRLVTEPFEGWQAYLGERVAWAKAPGHFQSMMAPHHKPAPALQVERPADPFPATLVDVAIPVHIVAGLRDPLVEPGWASLLAAQFASEVRVSEMDASHSPNLSHPQETWQLVWDFVCSVR